MPGPRKPVSEEQLAANRANATHSTGPSTPEGKAHSAQNARKHGFTAATFAVVRFEDLNEVDNLKADLVAVYQPVNAQELFAIERIALAQQALLRAARLEAGLFTSCLNETLDPSGEPFVPMAKRTHRRWRYRNHSRPESQLCPRRRVPSYGQDCQYLVPGTALSGPVRTPLPPRCRGSGTAPGPASRVTKRTHFGRAARTRTDHFHARRNAPAHTGGTAARPYAAKRKCEP